MGLRGALGRRNPGADYSLEGTVPAEALVSVYGSHLRKRAARVVQCRRPRWLHPHPPTASLSRKLLDLHIATGTLSRLREREGPIARRLAASDGRVRVARKRGLARDGSRGSVGHGTVSGEHSLTLPPTAAVRRSAGPSLSREARERVI